MQPRPEASQGAVRVKRLRAFLKAAGRADLERSQFPSPPGMESLNCLQLHLQWLVPLWRSVLRIFSVQVQVCASVVSFFGASHKVVPEGIQRTIYIDTNIHPRHLQPVCMTGFRIETRLLAVHVGLGMPYPFSEGLPTVPVLHSTLWHQSSNVYSAFHFVLGILPGPTQQKVLCSIAFQCSLQILRYHSCLPCSQSQQGVKVQRPKS